MDSYCRCERVRDTEHAPHGSLGLLERRHGLAEIVERGGGVLVECPRINFPDADLDKEFSCDSMETYTFYVAAGRVEHRVAACDYIDWTTTGRFQQNLGTI